MRFAPPQFRLAIFESPGLLYYLLSLYSDCQESSRALIQKGAHRIGHLFGFHFCG